MLAHLFLPCLKMGLFEMTTFMIGVWDGDSLNLQCFEACKLLLLRHRKLIKFDQLPRDCLSTDTMLAQWPSQNKFTRAKHSIINLFIPFPFQDCYCSLVTNMLSSVFSTISDSLVSKTVKTYSADTAPESEQTKTGFDRRTDAERKARHCWQSTAECSLCFNAKQSNPFLYLNQRSFIQPDFKTLTFYQEFEETISKIDHKKSP